MVDPRLAWFAIGAMSGAALFGWHWHPRFSRYSRGRGRNPPLPGRKPAPPAGPPEQPLGARLIRYWAWEQEQARRAWLGLPAEDRQPEDRQPAPPTGPPQWCWRPLPPPSRLQPYGWGPGQLNPPPPAPGMRREYLWSPPQMAECGGPCWKAQDPRCCDCGALWRDVRDVPIRLDEGQVQRGNGNGGPTTPKPLIKPKPTGGHLAREGRLWGGYQPRPQGGTPNPPSSEP